jgi:hypothetical protein
MPVSAKKDRCEKIGPTNSATDPAVLMDGTAISLQATSGARPRGRGYAWDWARSGFPLVQFADTALDSRKKLSPGR